MRAMPVAVGFVESGSGNHPPVARPATRRIDDVGV